MRSDTLLLDRLHVTMPANLSVPGGLNSVAIGVAQGQRDSGLRVGIQSGLSLGRRGSLDLGSGAFPTPRHVHADVIQYHFPLTTLLQPARLKRTAHLAHFHGPWALEGKFEGANWARSATKRLVEALAYHQSSVFVAHSQAFANVLSAEYEVRPEKISVIYPGVDFARFYPVNRTAARLSVGLPAERKIVGSCRRLVPRMGLELLLRAAARLDGVVVALAGTGPLASSLKILAEDLGITDRVIFLGYVADHLLNDFYNAVDLCCVPSVALEGFGLTILEAQAAGTPVVASDVGGLPEAVGVSKWGWTFSSGDESELESLMQQILQLDVDQQAVRAGVLAQSWAATAREVEDLIAARLV
jgi:glycosyltransferase involved in cell wall biosynthesis